MAGLQFWFGAADPARAAAVQSYLRFGDESEALISDGLFQCVWLGHERAALHAPAYDAATGVHLITSGRAVLRDATPPDDLPGTGGTINRILLQRYLTDGVHALDGIDGAVVVCVWDPRSQQVHLWTDHFGYHPAFLHCPHDQQQCVFSTFPDAIAHDPTLQLTWDRTAMAEFLSAWRITPPNTYFREVKHAGAATRWTWSLADETAVQATYWTPFEQPFYPSIKVAAAELTQAVRAALQDRTDQPTVCYVSGGADSRVMLFGARDPSQIVGITLFDEPNAEADVAQQLCERAGARYVGFKRDLEYYPRLLPEIARWSGGMWSAQDSHCLGTRDVVTDAGAQVVMTACTTDWLFKAYGLEKTPRRFLGKNLPLTKLAPARVEGFLPNQPSPMPDTYAAAARQRLATWFDQAPSELRTDRDRLQVEDRRVRPACYAVSVSGPIMYRLFPYDTFLADARVAACYERIRPEWKLDGRVWGMAAAEIAQDAKDIVDSNHGWPVGASTTHRLWRFGRGWIGRRVNRILRRQRHTGPATDSWSDYGWFVRNSEMLATRWQATPTPHRERLNAVLGRDAWEPTLADWSLDSARYFRMITLLAHWAANEHVIDPA